MLGPVAALDGAHLAPYMARAQARGQAVQSPDGMPLYVVEGDGVAVINVEGPLARNALAWRGYLWLDGYDRIASALAASERDQGVLARVLRIDSPGGTAIGLGQAARAADAERGRKPLLTYADELAASAGYYWFAIGDEALLPPEAYVGSIGTILMHADFSRALEEAGIKLTMFVDPEGKANGRECAPLTEAAKAELQGVVSAFSADFFSHVAKRRGLSVGDVRGMDARMFRGKEAVKMGLADGVASWSEVIAKAGKLGRKAQKERMQEVKALLGLPDTASEEDVKKAAQEAKPVLALGRVALSVSGESDPERAGGVLLALAADASDAKKLRADAQNAAAAKLVADRNAALDALLSIEPPAAVFVGGERKNGESRWVSEMTTGGILAYCENRKALGGHPAMKARTEGALDNESNEPTEVEVKAYAKNNGLKNLEMARVALKETRKRSAQGMGER